MTETSSPTLRVRREQMQRPQPDNQAQMFGRRQHAEFEHMLHHVCLNCASRRLAFAVI